jgi:hypothetical protein
MPINCQNNSGLTLGRPRVFIDHTQGQREITLGFTSLHDWQLGPPRYKCNCSNPSWRPVLRSRRVTDRPNYAVRRTHVIVLKTSDCCARYQTIPVVCHVSSGNPESSTFHIRSGSLQKTLQYYNSWYKNITSELNSGSITNHKFTNHLFKSYIP